MRTESIGAATYRYSDDDMGNITKIEELVNGAYVTRHTYQYDSQMCIRDRHRLAVKWAVRFARPGRAVLPEIWRPAKCWRKSRLRKRTAISLSLIHI